MDKLLLFLNNHWIPISDIANVSRNTGGLAEGFILTRLSSPDMNEFITDPNDLAVLERWLKENTYT